MPSHPRLTLPAFLQPGSPPRSPHTAPPTVFQSYFSSAPGTSSSSYPPTSSSRSSILFRPTRRDLLLVLLTLSFSYLFLSPQTDADFSTPRPNRHTTSSQLHSIPGPVGSEGSYRPSWKFWPIKPASYSSHAACPSAVPREPTFGESVKTYGVSLGHVAEGGTDQNAAGAGGEMWDGGEVEDEDDQLEGSRTVLRGHQPGWTLFEKLYIYNGTFYVVTDEPAEWPELRLMTSTGLPANGDPGNEQAREPTGEEIKFITPFKAMQLWGPRVYKMDGMTWLWNDGQFLDHYYHFAAELLLGTWRTYTSLDPGITARGETKLPPPKRLWFLHQHTAEWRDHPGFNTALTYALFPSTSMLYPEDFADFRRVTAEGSPKAFMLERALLADRSAAFRGPYTAPTARTVASACEVGTASRWWWEPIRRQMLRYSGVSEDIIDRNFEGHGAIDPASPQGDRPTSTGSGLEPEPASGLEAGGGVNVGPDPAAPVAPGDYVPLVTYISRQKSRRHLTDESHADLLKAMEERSKKVGFQFLVVEAERMTKEEQIALAARTTILLGVHGNGLTHLIWMPATPRSAVIEMFFDGGFARDYQWTAHALGIRHFAVQHDKSFTAPNLAKVDYPEGFQGPAITVVGKVVADIVEDRLAGKV